MTAIVDHVFPPIDGHEPQMALDYSSFTFWRDPLPQIIDEPVKEESAEESEAKSENQLQSKDQASEKSDNSTSSSSNSSPSTVVETINDGSSAATASNPK